MSGACCLVYYCLFCTEPICSYYGGTYLGNSTLCEPNPCRPAEVGEVSQALSPIALRAVPNPSVGSTLILYTMPGESAARMDLYDPSGAIVRGLDLGVRPAGSHSIEWDGRDSEGRDLPSGVYIARIATSSGSATTRIVIIR
jgi:hypothetical protein